MGKHFNLSSYALIRRISSIDKSSIDIPKTPNSTTAIHWSLARCCQFQIRNPNLDPSIFSTDRQNHACLIAITTLLIPFSSPRLDSTPSDIVSYTYPCPVRTFILLAPALFPTQHAPMQSGKTNCRCFSHHFHQTTPLRTIPSSRLSVEISCPRRNLPMIRIRI